MADDIPDNDLLRVADLPQHRPTRFSLTPDKARLSQIAAQLEALDIRKLVFDGQIAAENKTDWRLDAKLGATVIQPCVVTLEPVTTRIDQTVTRRFLANFDQNATEDEVEMPDDETQEALGAEIDLIQVLTEALALALPDYPRSPDATLEQTTFTRPGAAPMTDDETKPFASLASLKEKLEKPN